MAPSPKIVLNIATLPVISTSELALLVVTVVGEDVALEVVEPLTEDVDVAVDDAEVVAVEFPELEDDTVDLAEEVELLEDDELAVLLGLPPISTNSPTVAPSPSFSQQPSITSRT